MKTENIVVYILRLALTLLAITAVVAAALAGVNSVTAPAIAELNAQKICYEVLRHRIGLTYEAEAENMTSDQIISEIINAVEVP